jgi:hypothetical protein
VPVVLHKPVALQASRPMSHAPFLFLGVAMHVPLLAWQLPVLQSSVLPEQFIVAPLHTPLAHLSPVVHLFPSLHAMVLFLF